MVDRGSEPPADHFTGSSLRRDAAYWPEGDFRRNVPSFQLANKAALARSNTFCVAPLIRTIGLCGKCELNRARD